MLWPKADQRLRVLFINEFGDPQCPVTELVYDLGHFLAADSGWTSSQLNLRTRYRPGGTTLPRIISLLCLHLLLPFMLFAYKLLALWQGQRLLVVSTTLPPLIHWQAILWGRILRMPVITWYQDAHPEIEARILAERGLPQLAAALRWLDRHILGLGQGFISLDEAMQAALIERLGSQAASRQALSVVPPWVTFHGDGLPLRAPRTARRKKLRLLYAGNYGYAHDLSPLAAAIQALSPTQQAQIELSCIGMNAAAQERLRALFASTAIDLQLLPRQESRAGVLALMAEFDYGIVSLAMEQSGLASPSKAYTYLSQGLPLFYVGPAATLAASLCAEGYGLNLHECDWLGLLQGELPSTLKVGSLVPSPRRHGPPALRDFMARVAIPAAAQPVRICVFSTLFDHGGPVRYWADIMAAQPQLKFDVFCNEVPGLGPPPFAAPELRYIRGLIWKKPLATMRAFWHYLDTERPDVVAFNGTMAELLVLPLLPLARLRYPRMRYLGIYHNVAIYPSARKNLLNRLSLSVAGLLHQRNVFVSQAVATYWWCRGTTITRPYQPKPRAQRRAPGPFVIGFCGRLSPEKGPDQFLAVLRLVQSRFPLKILIVGDGQMRAELAAALPEATFTGWVREPRSYLQQMDVLLSTSRTEGYPLALGESLEMGTPVLGFAVGGVREVLPKAASSCLVSPGDTASLAARLSDFLASYDEHYADYFAVDSASAAPRSLTAWAQAVLAGQ